MSFVNFVIVMEKTIVLRYLELLIVVIIWGASFVASKYALQSLSPVLLTFTRFTIASFLFAPIIYLKKKIRQNIERKDVPMLALLGLLGITLLMILQLFGLKYTSATNVSLLITLTPIITLLLSRKILKEKTSIFMILGIVMGLIGAFLVVTNGSLGISTRTNDLIGAMFIFSNIICWSLYTVLGKKILEKYPADLVTAYVTIFGTLLIVPFLLAFNENFGVYGNLDLYHWTSIMYLAFFSSFIGYSLWYRVLKYLKASTVTTFMYIEPLSTIILANLLLREVLTIYVLFGGVMIILGVFFATIQNETFGHR